MATREFSSGRDHVANQILAEITLGSLSPGERLGWFEKAFWSAVKRELDESALEILGLSQTTIQGIEEEKAEKDYDSQAAARRTAREIFLEKIESIYWELPDGNVFPKLRLEIIRGVASSWSPSITLPPSCDAFDFLKAAYKPGGSRYKDETRWEKASRGKKDPDKELREKILDIIHQRARTIGFGDNPDKLFFWIKRTRLPEDVAEVLAKARIEEAGIERIFRDAWYADMLGPFEVEKRSSAGLELHTKLCEAIKDLDHQVGDLLKAMQPEEKMSFRPNTQDRQIGGSEYVIGKITTVYNSLQAIEISVVLEDSCDRGLSCCIFGRAKRHIRKWLEEIQQSVSVVLRMDGGGFKVPLVYPFNRTR